MEGGSERRSGYLILTTPPSLPPSPSSQDTFKDLYGQAFGLYTLSYYYLASKDKEALSMATRLFDLLLER